MSWDSGYVTDIDYTHGHYTELDPHRAQFALTYAGIKPLDIDAACELGFGQGVSLNINAAGSDIKWYGTDFNPNQALNAKQVAKTHQGSLQIFDDDFLTLLENENLPDFDFISLHGIWSWISDENRTVISEFIRRKLKIGGVVYISYNTLPGWNQMIPIRNLMMDLMEASTPPQDLSSSRVGRTLNIMEDLTKLGLKHLAANPAGQKKLESLVSQNKNYVAHEYFNRDWMAMNFSDISSILQNSKINYVASANLLENIDVLNLSNEQAAYLSGLESIKLRETLRDYMINQTFRRDYWVKGSVRFSAPERIAALDKFRLIAAKSLKNFDFKLKCNIGEANLTESVYAPIIELMSDHELRTVKEIRQALVKTNDISVQQILEALYILVGSNTLILSYDAQHSKKVNHQASGSNKHLMAKSIEGNHVNFLVSPLTGSGIPVGRIDQIFIHLLQTKVKDVETLATKTQSILEQRGHSILKDGKAVPTGEELFLELSSRAKMFLEQAVPIYKKLHIL